MIRGGKSILEPPEADVMARHFGGSLAGLALIAALVACSPGGGAEPTRAGTPSSPASVSPSSSPTPDVEALYAEAEGVLRRSLEIQSEYMQTGDFDEYPPEFYDLLADPYLSYSQADFVFNKENGFRGGEGASATLTVRPLTGVSKNGSEVALATCLDTRSAPLLDAQGNVVSEGGLFNPTYFFKHSDGRLKLFLSDAGEEIDQCPF